MFLNFSELSKKPSTWEKKYVFCSVADIVCKRGDVPFFGVDVPKTPMFPIQSGSWSQSHCFLQCGHPTEGEVQTMAFHWCWMQIHIVCWERGLTKPVVGGLQLDKWTGGCGAAFIENWMLLPVYLSSFFSGTSLRPQHLAHLGIPWVSLLVILFTCSLVSCLSFYVVYINGKYHNIWVYWFFFAHLDMLPDNNNK